MGAGGRPVGRGLLVGALLWVILAPAAGAAGSNPAEPMEYVALGDSYSSGEGAVGGGVSFFVDTPPERNSCHRSPAAYPLKLAATLGLDLGGSTVPQESPWGFVACSGARTVHVDGTVAQYPGEPAGQISRLGPDTGLVTVTVGGNDVEVWRPSNPEDKKRGLADVFVDCVFRVCHELTESNLPLLGLRLEDAYRDVAAKASNATVVVLTYPQIFAGDARDDCVGGDGIEPREIAWIRSMTGQLNQVIVAAALAAGVTVSRQENAFVDHWACSDVPYANELAYLNTKYSFHPNIAGHARMAQLAAASLGQRRGNADLDGDFSTEVGVYRPSDGLWFVNRSSGGSAVVRWGTSTDVPVPGDYDGDGRADIAVWRPSSGEWFVNHTGGGITVVSWGLSNDVPLVGDYNGDGRADIAVWRPSTGDWFIRRSSGGAGIERWGVSSDVPVPADYDGDGQTDIAVWRPSSGEWFVKKSTGGVSVTTWGVSTDVPVAGDYDGDGQADVAVWRPSTGHWFIRQSAAGAVVAVWGVSTDVPVSGDYDGDGRMEVTVWRPSTGEWFVHRGLAAPRVVTWGVPTDVPVRVGPAIRSP